MDATTKIKDDAEACDVVEGWVKKQKFQRSTEDCYKELPQIRHIMKRSLGRYLSDQWKLFGKPKKPVSAGGKRTADAAAMMAIARGGGRLKTGDEEDDVEEDDSILSPPVHRKSLYSSPLCFGCAAYTHTFDRSFHSLSGTIWLPCW